MSRRNGMSPQLDLKLNLSPPRAAELQAGREMPRRSVSPSPTSPQSSCVSSEVSQQDETVLHSSSSAEGSSMMLVGCPRCLMYVMLKEGEPRCPQCKTTVLLDILHHNFPATTVKRST